MRPRRSLPRLLVVLAVLAPSLAAAEPARLMPKYRGERGTSVDDPVQLKAERRAFDSAFEQYRQAARDYQSEVKEFITREVRSRQKTIDGGYKNQIDTLEQAEIDLRRAAIERLEGFVFRHRDHDTYTPDTLFRLAELYYEDTKAQYARSSDNLARDMDLYNRGKLLDPPTDVDQDFARSIAVYKYLHWVPEGTKMDKLSGKLEGVKLDKRWPNYKYSDVAMYLQGFCEAEGGDMDKAIATLSQLEAHYPDSKHVAEAWLRVGEMYFDQADFEGAANAYQRAADRAQKTNDRRNYSLALYKLGWSMFQQLKYPEAVRYFQKLIEFEDSLAAKAKDEKDSFDLRKEAIEYLAKSLAEPSWDEDGCDDFGGEDAKSDCLTMDARLRPRMYVASVLEPKYDDLPDWRKLVQGEAGKRLDANLEARNQVRRDMMNGKPYTFDILVTYGNTLFDQATDDYYRQALLVLGYVVDHWPLAREAQGLQRKVLRSVDILANAQKTYQAMLAKNPNDPVALQGLAMSIQDQDRQIAERRKYLAMFSKGTPWYEKWGSDKDLAAQVDEMVGKVRMDFAQLTHQQGQALREAGDEDGALAKYAEAAAEYEKLLKEDKSSARGYELAWTLAEILFFTGKRCDALRDKNGGILMATDPATKKLSDDIILAYPDKRAPDVKKSCEYMKKSIEYYGMVRDWQGPRGLGSDGKPLDLKEPASISAVQAARQVLTARGAYPVMDTERLDSREVPELRPSADQDSAELEANKDKDGVVRVTPRNIDASTVDWLLSVDAYIRDNPVNPKEDPTRIQKLALAAGELLYKNRQFDPNKGLVTPRTDADFWSARKRFWAIIEKYPTSPQASEAYKDLIATYQIEHDYAMLDEARKYGDEHAIGDAKERDKIRKEVIEVSLGALDSDAKNTYERAEKRAAEADKLTNPEEAGKAFAEARSTYKRAGDVFFNLRHSITPEQKDYISRQKQALMNAVRSYYRAEAWDDCEKVLKEAEEKVRGAKTDDPVEKKKNVERLQEIIETRVELEYKFLKVAEAIADFRALYETDPKGDKAAYYLTSAADLAFYNSNWDLAILLDRQIVTRFEADVKNKEAARKSAVRIAQSYQKKGDIPGQIAALEEFNSRNEKDRSMSGQIFRNYTTIADIYESRGDRKSAEKMYQRILDAFQKGGFEKNGGPEATAAAQAQFRLIEPRYDAFMKMKLVENTKLAPSKRVIDMQNQLKAMLDIINGPERKVKNATSGEMETVRGGGLYDEYETAVASYGSRDWSYAAYLYRGKMLTHQARTIYEAPRPDGLSDAEQEQYDDILEKNGAQFENRAIKSLELALKDADAKGVVNQWVTELRKAINKYKPNEYPLLKDEKRLTVDPPGTLTQPDTKELR
jgi:tetratricopeptide (TPR) repeat protein/TolA-binding protein